MEIPKIHEGEYRFCLIMWEHEPISAAQLVKLCQEQLGWKRTTTYTVIKRLGERGILKNEDGIVTALVSKDEAQACEIDELVENRQYEHIRKLGCDCGFDIAVLLEKSSQMGKCSALGHCRCTDGFPVFD